MRKGSFIVYETGSSYRPHASGIIASVTPAMVRLSSSTNYNRQIYRDRIVAVFDNAAAAERLEQSLADAYGEFSRRRHAANAEMVERVSKAHAAFAKVANRLIASAIEARSDATGAGAAEGESAVGDSRDAQSTAASSASAEGTTLNDARMEKGQDQ